MSIMTSNRTASLSFLMVLLSMLFCLAWPASLAIAQTPADLAGRAERAAVDLKTEVEKLKADVSIASVRAEDLTKARSELEDLRTETLAAQNVLSVPKREVEAQLKKLGEPPKSGDSEADAIAAERMRLMTLSARINSAATQLELINLEAVQLLDHIAERQRSDFVAMVLEGTRSVINPNLWIDALSSVPQFFERFSVLIGSWRSDTSEAGSSFWFVVFTFTAAYLLIAALWIGWHRPRDLPLDREELPRMWRAIRIPLFSIAILLVAGAAIELLANLQPRPGRVTLAALRTSLGIIVPLALLRATFRPGNPKLRLVNLDTSSARKAYQIGAIIFILAGSRLVVEEVASLTFLPVEFLLGWKAALSIALAVLIGIFLVVVRSGEAIETVATEGVVRRFYFEWSRYVFHLIWLVLLVSALALLVSRIELAYYLLTRIVATSGLVVLLVMLRHLIDAVVHSALDQQSLVGRFLQRTVSLSDRAISTLGLVLTSLADVGVVLLGIPIVLVQWTLTWIDFQSWMIAAFFGFKIGDIRIELSSILLGVLVLIIGLLAARLFTAWLERRVLARTNLDAGIRNSIRTGTNYAGIMLAAGIAVTSAGLDFSNLAIVFGALGVGIGFGLQSIVNNFVSGLILLAERPIKVGDWIAVTGGEGIVKRINVRSTEIETFDRCSVIIPNSNLISEPVSNWYHNDESGRVRVPVGVAYNSDPEKVKEILLNCAYETERVVAFPEPFVVFMNFGASSLDFELRAYIADVGWVTIVGSELRFKIFKALKEAGIEIPFPQQDIHVKGLGGIGPVQIGGRREPEKPA